MSYQRERRRRRRRIAVVLVAALVVLGVAYAITRIQSEGQLRRQYLDLALEVAQAEADLAGRLDDLVTRLEQVGRPGMVATLDELQERTAALARDVEVSEALPGDLGRGQQYLEIATGRWRDGIANIRQGLATLGETPMDEGGFNLLAQGLTDLRVGDSAYAGFMRAIGEAEAEEVGQPFPEVRFVPEESEILLDAEDLARRLTLTPGLAVLEDLAIADLRLDPGPVGERVGLPLVPVSERLDVEVTVSNRGTESSAVATVRLSLVSQDGTAYETGAEVGNLAPGGLTTVRFPDLPVEAGKLYEIAVALTSEDDDPSNDRLSFTFIRDSGG